MSPREIRDALKAVRLSALDRVVGYFSPESLVKRYAARATMALAGGYTGASKSRRQTAEWKTSKGASADADLIPDLDTLRDRSGDLERNCALAAGAINTVVSNVVGTGLGLQSQIDAEFLGMSTEAAAEWQRNTEREFNLWAGCADYCDITRTQDFYEMQGMALRGTLCRGDIFFLTPSKKHRGNDPYGLKLQAIEADRVRNKLGVAATARQVAGVEKDEFGAPVAYHIARAPAGALYRSSTEVDRVPAFGELTGRRQVLHLFDRKRPEQTRGEPYLSPVIEPLKQLDRYTEAEIMAAVISGMFTVFVKSAGEGISPAAPMALGAETGASSSDSDIKLASGAIVDLREGESIETANPGRPNQAFDPFVQAVLRQIGVALELPFEVLIKHFTASYSAARAAILEAWRFYKRRRAWLATKFCQPVYELFLEEAIATGRIAAPGFFDDPLYRAAYSGAQWNGDGPGYLNPAMEAEAAEKRMQIGLTTLKGETAEYNGGDWERNHKQQVVEKQARRADGLEQDAAPAAPAVPGAVSPQPNDREQPPPDEREVADRY